MPERRFPSPVMRAGNRLLAGLHWAGLHPGPMYLLTVPGRKTGRPHTNPVAPVAVEGRLYLLEAFPGADWVKNARTAGHGTLTRGRRSQTVRLTEIPAADRPPILREFPRQNRPGVRVFISNGVVTSANPESFAAAAPHCHVFAPTRAQRKVGRRFASPARAIGAAYGRFRITGNVGHGGVWVPGGPPGLQNRWTALGVVGGFDSRPPPRTA